MFYIRSLVFCAILLSFVLPFLLSKAYAAPYPAVISNKIGGLYWNPQAGYAIQFPAGWNGIELDDKLSMVAPHGVNSSNQDNKEIMVVIALDKSSVKRLVESQTNIISNEVNLANTKGMCTPETNSFVSFNGLDALHVVINCEESGIQTTKTNAYAIMTTNRLIIVAFSANSLSGYESDVAQFEKAVNTLAVNKPVAIKTAMIDTLGLRSEKYLVKAKGRNVEVDVDSNSKISNFTFDENRKSLSFIVEGANGTTGFTMIKLDTILEAPYSVSIDGQSTTDFSIINDEVDGGGVVQINYHQSSHDITITGANVAPEFPTYTITLIIASIIGIISAITTKSSHFAKRAD